MALTFSEKCSWAEKAAMIDLEKEKGQVEFYKMARESRLGEKQLSYYSNAYEVAGAQPSQR